MKQLPLNFKKIYLQKNLALIKCQIVFFMKIDMIMKKTGLRKSSSRSKFWV